jgi:hypothetical protein
LHATRLLDDFKMSIKEPLVNKVVVNQYAQIHAQSLTPTHTFVTDTHTHRSAGKAESDAAKPRTAQAVHTEPEYEFGGNTFQLFLFSSNYAHAFMLTSLTFLQDQ